MSIVPGPGSRVLPDVIRAPYPPHSGTRRARKRWLGLPGVGVEGARPVANDQVGRVSEPARPFPRTASAEHLEQLERVAANAKFLADVSTLFSWSLDVNETLNSTARLMVPKVADMATVHLFDEIGVLRGVALAHCDPVAEMRIAETDSEEGLEARNALLTLATKSGSSAVLAPRECASGVQEGLDEANSKVLVDLGITSALAVPLVARGETLGLLALFRFDGSPSYDATDISFAEELSRRAAVAIDNALVHKRQADVARTLQASLLPPTLSDLPGLEVAATFHPAGEGVEVGGDFYDVFPLGDNRWVLMIGDVSGSGPAAAALTAQVRHGARVAARAGLDPPEVVAAINASLDETTGSEWFCTMVYAEVSVHDEGADLQIVCAGHPPPIVLRGEVVEAVGVQGPLLGVLPLASFGVRAVRLGPGHALIMVTDGALEARATTSDVRGADEFFGQERLEHTIRGCVGRPASVIVKSIADEILSMCGGQLADDLAVLVVRRHPVGARPAGDP